jgi:cyclase
LQSSYNRASTCRSIALACAASNFSPFAPRWARPPPPRDHTGGNENLGKSGALIVAHENVRKRMSSDQFIEFINMKVSAEPRDALPVGTFANDVTFRLNGDEILVRHVPRAHTDGDAIVHFRNSDVLHMGDIFFNTMKNLPG